MKVANAFFLASLLILGIITNLSSGNPVHSVYSIQPPYAKWGQIAMQETKEKYPQANIIDYLHIGREVGTKTSTEKFMLLLRENSQEFTLFVNVTFDNATEQLIEVSFREVR